MARRKIPEQETPQAARIRQLKEHVANTPSRSEKISWERKHRNILAIVETQLEDVENKILSLLAEKGEILANIAEIRAQMVDECIHPFDMLEVQENCILCKFCGKRIGLPNDKEIEHTTSI